MNELTGEFRTSSKKEAIELSSLTASDYQPESVKRKIQERLVQELHDPTIKGMVLYKLCAELLDRLEGKPIARTDINVRSQAILVIEASGD